MTDAFWRGRRVFVTGHTGFKGSWLTIWLRRLGARVTGYALAPPTNPSLFALAGAGEGIDDRRADVRDPDALEAAMRDAEPEVVFHLAAQSLVRASYDTPVETYATNVLGTVHTLDSIRRVATVRAAVVVTSDKCYENRELDRGYTEEDPLGGHDPYSSSKACAEIVTAAYRRSFFTGDSPGTGVASARAGNVIGGGDWAPDRLMPDLVAAFAAGLPASIRNPLATRPWQHVLEPLGGYLLLAERLHGGDRRAARAWNFGPSPAGLKPVGWIADEAARCWGGSASWQIDSASHPHEARSLQLDVSKARAELGWEPALSLAESVEWTVQWHRSLKAGSSAGALVERDIAAYTERVARGHAL